MNVVELNCWVELGCCWMLMGWVVDVVGMGFLWVVDVVGLCCCCIADVVGLLLS